MSTSALEATHAEALLKRLLAHGSLSSASTKVHERVGRTPRLCCSVLQHDAVAALLPQF